MEVQYPRKIQNHEIHEIQKSRRNESPKSQLDFCSFFRQFNGIQNSRRNESPKSQLDFCTFFRQLSNSRALAKLK